MTDKLVVVGQISGAFGVRGEVRVRSFTDDPAAAFKYGSMLDEAGSVVLTPVRVRALNDGFGVMPSEKREREEWEAMRGRLLYARRAALPVPAAGEFYVADLVGMSVVHIDGRTLGDVAAVQNFGAGELIEVRPAHGASYFLPFTQDVFPVIDAEARLLRADPDEGFLPDDLQRQSSVGRRKE